MIECVWGIGPQSRTVESHPEDRRKGTGTRTASADASGVLLGADDYSTGRQQHAAATYLLVVFSSRMFGGIDTKSTSGPGIS